eukprot:COSAG06_NODE_18833_length_866_cov_1.153846_1_plen_271_part_10
MRNRTHRWEQRRHLHRSRTIRWTRLQMKRSSGFGSPISGLICDDFLAQPTVTDESGCTPSVVESAGANEATVKKPSSRRRRTKKSRRSTSQTRPSTPVDRAYVAISEPAQNATVPMTSQSDMETVAWRQRYGFTVTPPSDDVLDVAPSQTLTQATTTPRLRQAWNRLGFPKGTDGNGSLTHIQQQTWPVVALGYDLLAFAATGKGKTLAFGAPALDAVFQEVNSSCNIAGEAVDVAGKRPVTSAPNGYQLPSSIRPSNVARLVVVQATKEM